MNLERKAREETMIRPIVRDAFFLSRRSEPAGPEDLGIAKDLRDTLAAHRDECVGMAANMIGSLKRIIIVSVGMLLLVCLALLAAGCGAPQKENETDSGEISDSRQETETTKAETQEETKTKASYTQISQEEARERMEKEDGHIVLDVRRQEEYEAGHIPGAILLPNETIGGERPAELPDPEQVILIYCRSGNRSKEAAQKLADLGYTHVFEFGGIQTWTGEIVTGAEESDSESQKEEKKMRLWIGEREVPVTWEANESVEALRELLPLTISMSMYGGFEQVGPIGKGIAREDEQTVTEAGDIVLYSGNQMVIFYGSNSWSYTRLGHVDLSRQEMTELLSGGDVTIQIREE